MRYLSLILLCSACGATQVEQGPLDVTQAPQIDSGAIWDAGEVVPLVDAGEPWDGDAGPVDAGPVDAGPCPWMGSPWFAGSGIYWCLLLNCGFQWPYVKFLPDGGPPAAATIPGLCEGDGGPVCGEGTDTCPPPVPTCAQVECGQACSMNCD
jgi:hypothetical protein